MKEDKIKYKDLELSHYRNTRSAFANLNITDLVKAAVLAPLNILLVGNTGSGKTQLAADTYNNYFNGNIQDGGRGIFIRAHPELDIYNGIFTKINIKEAERELTDNINALVYVVDEINRAPVVAQNQFFGLGDGKMDYKGRSIKLGQQGYNILIATANIGNGEFQGTFQTDKALYNRLHLAIDFDYEMFKPTKEDEFSIDEVVADPNVKGGKKQDLSDKIIEASKEIGEITKDPGLEALAVVNYLRFGLNNCQKYETKDKVWPLNCQDCEYNKDDALCPLIKAPVRRTINAMTRYAAALQYLSKLKNPNQELDTIDLMFKAFELTGSYQFLLNPYVLRQEYHEQNPKMMAEITEKLKNGFRKNEDYILSSIEAARKDKKVTRFFLYEGKLGDYDVLKDDIKEEVDKIEPYTNNRDIGLQWMNDYIDFIIKQETKNKK